MSSSSSSFYPHIHSHRPSAAPSSSYGLPTYSRPDLGRRGVSQSGSSFGETRSSWPASHSASVLPPIQVDGQRSPTSSIGSMPRSPPPDDRAFRGTSSATNNSASRTASAQIASSSSSGDIVASSAAGTGRKRKRLQRACDPCHKAKRRCDGGLPCSNCDFSGRGCSYTDSQGNAVQPTARAKPPVNGNAAAPRSDPSFDNGASSQMTSPQNHWATAPSGKLQSSRSLLPASPGFHSDLKALQSSVPFVAVLPAAYLQGNYVASDSLLALAARDRSRFQSSASTEHTAAICQLLSAENEEGKTLLDHSSAETALGLIALAFSEAKMGKLNRAVAFSTQACRVIADVDLSSAVYPFTVHDLARLLCVVYVFDILLASLAGKTGCVGVTDLEIAAAHISATAVTTAGDATTSALHTLLKAATVFVRALDHRRKVAHRVSGNQISADASITACHQALNSWADELPASLAFDDANLSRASRIQNRYDGHSESEAVWAWSWTMMHSFAEMSVCLCAVGGDSRYSAATSNLGVLLSSTLRQVQLDGGSIFTILPLLFASQPSANETSSRSNALLASVADCSCINEEQLRRARTWLGVSSGSPRGHQSQSSLGSVASSNGGEYRRGASNSGTGASLHAPRHQGQGFAFPSMSLSPQHRGLPTLSVSLDNSKAANGSGGSLPSSLPLLSPSAATGAASGLSTAKRSPYATSPSSSNYLSHYTHASRPAGASSHPTSPGGANHGSLMSDNTNGNGSSSNGASAFGPASSPSSARRLPGLVGSGSHNGGGGEPDTYRRLAGF